MQPRRIDGAVSRWHHALSASFTLLLVITQHSSPLYNYPALARRNVLQTPLTLPPIFSPQPRRNLPSHARRRPEGHLGDATPAISEESPQGQFSLAPPPVLPLGWTEPRTPREQGRGEVLVRGSGSERGDGCAAGGRAFDAGIQGGWLGGIPYRYVWWGG